MGLGWPILRPTLTYVEPKDPKNGNSKKNTVKSRILWWSSAAYLGAMLAHLGAMLAYLEGNVGPSWGYVGPSWGYVGWPILGAMLEWKSFSNSQDCRWRSSTNSFIFRVFGKCVVLFLWPLLRAGWGLSWKSRTSEKISSDRLIAPWKSMCTSYTGGGGVILVLDGKFDRLDRVEMLIAICRGQ